MHLAMLLISPETTRFPIAVGLAMGMTIIGAFCVGQLIGLFITTDNLFKVIGISVPVYAILCAGVMFWLGNGERDPYQGQFFWLMGFGGLGLGIFIGVLSLFIYFKDKREQHREATKAAQLQQEQSRSHATGRHFMAGRL